MIMVMVMVMVMMMVMIMIMITVMIMIMIMTTTITLSQCLSKLQNLRIIDNDNKCWMLTTNCWEGHVVDDREGV